MERLLQLFGDNMKLLDEDVLRQLQVGLADDKIGEALFDTINGLVMNSNNGLFQFTQSFNNNAPPPTSGQFRVDVNDPANVTKFYLGYNASLNGQYNISRIFNSFLSIGSKFYMQRQQQQGATFVIGTVTGFADQGDYMEIDISVVESGGVNFGNSGNNYNWAFLFKI